MRRWAYNCAGLVVFLIWVFPVYWMVNTAFKPGKDMMTVRPEFWPHHVSLANFRTVVDDPTFWSSLRNTVFVALATVLIATVIAFLAALAISRFDFAGRKAFLAAVMIVQLVPLAAIIIPIFLNLSDLHLADTLIGLVLAYLVFALPFAVWTLRGFIANVPAELEEAAMVDGCTRLGAFRRIVLPLVLPGLVSTAIYTMILAWNEYLLTYFLISSSGKYTLPLWLTHFTLAEGVQYGPLMAGSTLIALPVVALFMLIQRRVAAGLTAGAVKG